MEGSRTQARVCWQNTTYVYSRTFNGAYEIQAEKTRPQRGWKHLLVFIDVATPKLYRRTLKSDDHGLTSSETLCFV